MLYNGNGNEFHHSITLNLTLKINWRIYINCLRPNETVYLFKMYIIFFYGVWHVGTLNSAINIIRCTIIIFDDKMSVIVTFKKTLILLIWELFRYLYVYCIPSCILNAYSKSSYVVCMYLYLNIICLVSLNTNPNSKKPQRNSILYIKYYWNFKPT